MGVGVSLGRTSSGVCLVTIDADAMDVAGRQRRLADRPLAARLPVGLAGLGALRHDEGVGETE